MALMPPLRVKKAEDQQLTDAKKRLKGRVKVGPKVPDGTPKPFFQEKKSMMTPLPTHGEAPLPPTPPVGVLATTRLGFGPSEAALTAFENLGATDAQRFQAWIDQQLDPATIDDSACDARVTQSGFTTLGKSIRQLWSQHALNDDFEIAMQPFWESTARAWIRAIHSKRQLFELMVDFWHNHFNVYGDDIRFGPLWAHYDRDVMRANSLGNFRDMLEDVATSPVMLFYLDNAFNSLEDANENYARETLELHTMGAEAYLGSMAPEDVPTDEQGVPVGYTEDDVVAAARCLTGWTVETNWVHYEFDNTGDFLYFDDWHDPDAKTVVGLQLPASQGPMQDGRDLFNHLCNHPATATFIAHKIARRLMADHPAQEVVDAAAATFLANTAAPDQIALVVRTVLEHPLFLETWGEKSKRPFEIGVSMFRGADLDLPFTLADWVEGNTGWFLWEYWQTGQPLFSWPPPNGYPDVKQAWVTSSPRVMSWRLANLLFSMWNEATDHWLFDLVAMTPSGIRAPQGLINYWSQRILGRALPDAESQPIVSFLAQEADPLVDLPFEDDWEAGERLRGAVALIMMSPTFLFR